MVPGRRSSKEDKWWEVGNSFGTSVDINDAGNIIAISRPAPEGTRDVYRATGGNPEYNYELDSTVYTLFWNGDRWELFGIIKDGDTSSGSTYAHLGRALALSADGLRIAISYERKVHILDWTVNESTGNGKWEEIGVLTYEVTPNYLRFDQDGDNLLVCANDGDNINDADDLILLEDLSVFPISEDNSLGNPIRAVVADFSPLNRYIITSTFTSETAQYQLDLT